ncbi:MAG: succinate dehydrogenase, cytochrome b556 subunit [Thermodesulfobacteriota bacterium]|nr:succinate dehydrogenase, cytochrome b556 subunit [Thermodesulfobacteriota bacterium]
MENNKRYDNHLELLGWAIGGKWGIERYLYTLHRITGVGILLFFVIHIFASSGRVFGPESWKVTMIVLQNPVFKIGEAFVFIGFAFHALNGIRLILIELGFMVGKPEQPVYPYQSSLDVQRSLRIAVMVIAGIIIVVGGIDIFFLA